MRIRTEPDQDLLKQFEIGGPMAQEPPWTTLD